MAFVKLFHNPNAGEGEHSEEKILAKIKAAGFDCSYSSTKEKIDEKRFPIDTDIIAVAGGDGSVRKLASYLLNKKVLEKPLPIALLPFGTANNIAHTLGIEGNADEIIERWKNENVKTIDVGNIAGVEAADFFVESFGFGVFPKTMRDMKDRLVKSDDPAEELRQALEKLIANIESYKPHACKIKLDDTEYSGNYLMVEVLNIRAVGPNLTIAPQAQPDDGLLDVVLIDEEKREKLKQYVINRLQKGKDEVADFEPLRAKKVEITWDGKSVHVDDQLLSVAGQKITAHIVPKALNFLV